MKGRVAVIAPGKPHDIYPFEYREPTLEELQAFVGGYIERVVLPDGNEMYVNEDGMALRLPVNVEATMMAGTLILGTVVVLLDGWRLS